MNEEDDEGYEDDDEEESENEERKKECKELLLRKEEEYEEMVQEGCSFQDILMKNKPWIFEIAIERTSNQELLLKMFSLYSEENYLEANFSDANLKNRKEEYFFSYGHSIRSKIARKLENIQVLKMIAEKDYQGCVVFSAKRRLQELQ